jgi:hypothetical protein
MLFREKRKEKREKRDKSKNINRKYIIIFLYIIIYKHEKQNFKFYVEKSYE